MIVFRYLSKEVFHTTVAVATVLLLIITSSFLIRYLADAAAGEISTSVVLSLLLHRIPKFLELLLPLSLFLGILLAHGRMYLDSEMIVLQACGYGPRKFVSFTLGPAMVVAVLVTLISLLITPASMFESKRIIADQKNRSDLEMLVPGTFQEQPRRNQVTYAQQIDEQGHLIDLFVSGVDPQNRPFLLVADRGEQRFFDDQGRFLILKEGYRYQGEPGVDDFVELAFSEYGIRLPDPKLTTQIAHLDATPTSELWGSSRSDYRGRLHWRLSLPVLAIVVALLAVSLAKTNPRQGRYAKLIPSILIYQIYVASLTTARSTVEAGDTGPWLLWFVHLCAIALALSFLIFENVWIRVLNKLPELPKFKMSLGR